MVYSTDVPPEPVPRSGFASARDDQAPRVRPYDLAGHHRAVRERLHTLDIINERFARQFRVNLFNLLRRNADVGLVAIRYQTFQEFAEEVQGPTNINLINMRPLRGTALIEFTPKLVFTVVDNLFGGDGRFAPRIEGRDFTATEQRIIQRLLDLALSAYKSSWQSVYKLEVQFVRAESQAKFANITNSPREIVISSTFHLDIGHTTSEFKVCLPYSMIEPLRDLLTNPSADRAGAHDLWTKRMAYEIPQSQVELVADFTDIPLRISHLLSLKPGDVIPIDLPTRVVARVDGTPVLVCKYGSHRRQKALKVEQLIDHGAAMTSPDELFDEPPPIKMSKQVEHE